MLRTSSLRVLRQADLPEVLALLACDPVAHVFVESRVRAVGIDPLRLSGELWGHVVDGQLRAVCHSGANLVPVEAGLEAARVFAERARRQGRRCATIVGPRESVAPLSSAWYAWTNVPTRKREHSACARYFRKSGRSVHLREALRELVSTGYEDKARESCSRRDLDCDWS